MPPQQRKTTIHGVIVNQTNLQGKWYTPVDARVKIAEQADPALIRREGASYNVVSVQFIEIAERWAYHCQVEYPAGSGVIKPGTDFIDTNDPSGVAKAETSAIGRALGLHGIATEESIASADEMSRVTGMAPEMDEGERVVDAPVERRQNAATRLPPAQAQQHAPTPQRQPAPAQPGARRPTDGPANEGDTGAHPTDAQATAIAKLCAKLGRPTPVFYTYTEASRLISVLTAEVKREQAAQAETAAANGHDLHDLHEAFPAGQRGA